MPDLPPGASRNQKLIHGVFFGRWIPGLTEIPFTRDDLVNQAVIEGITLPKNVGDVIYTVRYRQPLPRSITVTQPEGFEWDIEGVGTARYAFRLVPVSRIVPNENLVVIDIPEATPEIVRRHGLTDEQALLAMVRYNRLLDVFLGVATYSLQNHLRTNVEGIGQIEIDELYVGIDKRGTQYVIPVQAKARKDQIGIVQTKQDIAFCASRYPSLVCRAISAQFRRNDVVALFELELVAGQVKIVDERHYRLTRDIG